MMPIGIDDLQERLGADSSGEISEIFHIQGDQIPSVEESKSIIRKYFPEVELSESNSVVYCPLTMCNSLPKVNLRGRAYTPQVFINSTSTARDALVNLEHQIQDNSARADNIIGHIVCARSPAEIDKIELNSMSDLNFSRSYPMYALTSLYLRTAPVQAIFSDGQTKKRNWRTSAEVRYLPRNAGFMYEGEYIPLLDADREMLNCVEKNSIRRFKERDLVLLCGGKDGSVDFNGLAFTINPADTDTKTYSFVSGRQLQESNSLSGALIRGIEFPVEKNQDFNSLGENIDEVADKQLSELNSITPIGKTSQAEDGHQHTILSDGTILPVNGHIHHIERIHIDVGKKPVWSGVTSSQWEHVRSSDGEIVRESTHLHTFEINLREKPPKASEIDSELNSIFDEDQVMPLLKDTIEKINSRLIKLEEISSGKQDNNSASEITAIRQILHEIKDNNALEEAVTQEINSKVEEGELVKKEDHEQALETKEKELAEKHEKQLEAEKKLQTRLDEVSKLGIDLDYEFDEEEDGLQGTVRDYINSFDFDDSGEKQFRGALFGLKGMAEAQGASDRAKAEAAEQEANSNKKEKKPLLVGSGSLNRRQENNNKPKRGKGIFSS